MENYSLGADFSFLYKDIKPEFIFFSPKGYPYHFTYDYCLIIFGIKLRDIKGSDLHFIDWIRNEIEDQSKLNIEFFISFLSYFLVDNPPNYVLKDGTNPLKKLTLDLLSEIYLIFLDKIISRSYTKDKWLENVFYLNKRSFTNLESYENIPITEFLQMILIYNQDQANRKAEFDS